MHLYVSVIQEWKKNNNNNLDKTNGEVRQSQFARKL